MPIQCRYADDGDLTRCRCKCFPHAFRLSHSTPLNRLLLQQNPAVRFLTQTFRNVFYVRVGKHYVHLWHSQNSRSFEEASGETEVGICLLAP